VTPLGLSPQELAQALGRYRLRLHGLIRSLDQGQPTYLHDATYQALDELTVDLEVDLGARASSAGAERMTRIERDVLVPLLRHLHRELAKLGRGVPPPAWRTTLHAADAHVAVAERALAHP